MAIGAENLHFEANGAYTGEVSADMLKDLGVKYVIIGHSERRQYCNETDITVNKKVHAALAAGLHPIICVGESLEQRELGVTMDLIVLPGQGRSGRRARREDAPCGHRLRAPVGHRHRQDCHRRAGQRGLRGHPRRDPQAVRRPRGPQPSPSSTAAA